MARQIAEWLTRLATWLTRKDPKPKRNIVTDEPVVDREAYLAAWNQVVNWDPGKVVLAHMRHVLWSEAGAYYPGVPGTVEELALWQRKHEGRMEMIEELVFEATHNIGIGMPEPVEGPRAVGRVPEFEEDEVLL